MEAGLRQVRSAADLTGCGRYEAGCYRSRWFQGLEPQMEWLRLKMEGEAPMRVRIYVSEERPEPFSGPEDREPVLERQSDDLLLYGVRGRYLCFTVEPGAALKSFRLEFPGHSIDEGLPTVLQQNDMLRTLLGVYQSRYMDLNRETAAFAGRMHPDSEQALPQLARWLGAGRWTQNPELARKILPQAHRLAQLRGTGKGLRLLSELVTGCPCRIVENWKLEQNARSVQEKRENRRLFGSDGEGVTILIPPQVPRDRMLEFQALLGDFMPLGVRYHVVYLSDDMPMDGHSYLDQNASLRGKIRCEMDGREPEEWILE